MTKKELAQKANYTPQQISKIVNGHSRLTNEAAIIFAKVLDIDLKYLLLESRYMTAEEKA